MPRVGSRQRVASRLAVFGLVTLVGLAPSGCDANLTGTASSGTCSVDQDPDVPPTISATDLIPILTRSGVGPGQLMIELTYAPPIFFEVSGLQAPAEMASRPTLAFMLQETVHEGALPNEPPVVLMVLESGDRATPYETLVTAADPHHRTTRLLFPDPLGWPANCETPGGERVLKLVVPLADGTVSAGNTFEWRLPLLLESEPSARTDSRGASVPEPGSGR